MKPCSLKDLASPNTHTHTQPEDDHEVGLDPDPAALQEIANAPQAMKDSDIRTMKDQLLIETAQLLGVTLFTAEALLKNHGRRGEKGVRGGERGSDGRGGE